MKNSVSRRNVVKGAAWATPIVVASASVPAFASSLCTPDITLDVPTNTTTNGDSVTHTFTAGNIEVMTFTLLGGAGGTYQGNARDGHGGSGALVTGTLDLNPTDEVTFIIAGGGGPYNNTPSTPGKGWADGGSHSEAIMDENEYTKRYKEHSSKSLINELYGPTGGGASAILLMVLLLLLLVAAVAQGLVRFRVLLGIRSFTVRSLKALKVSNSIQAIWQAAVLADVWVNAAAATKKPTCSSQDLPST